MNLIPRAERLVYRKPGEQLLLTVNPDKNRYSPGGKVSIDIAAMNEKERSTPAILLVGVVNQSVIAMADNKTDRLMPTHFLLAGDVKSPAASVTCTTKLITSATGADSTPFRGVMNAGRSLGTAAQYGMRSAPTCTMP